MEFISTTATAADKLKRLAKTLRKTTGSSLAVALDAIAKQHGYEHWKHVTVCEEQTATIRRTKPLPERVRQYLDRMAERHPAHNDTHEAFTHGFVFAMDVKDTEQLALTEDYAECEDGWHIAARDVWRNFMHYRDLELGTTRFESLSFDDLVTAGLDDLQNYRFFRYVGTLPPSTLEDAYRKTSEMSFFPPTHTWTGGTFTCIDEIEELRVDGKVVVSSLRPSIINNPQGKRTRFEKFGHLLNQEERVLFDRMNKADQDFWLFQLEKETAMGKTRYQSLSHSVSVKWRG